MYNNFDKNKIHFESPITGELIEIAPPFSAIKYNAILIKHIKQYT